MVAGPAVERDKPLFFDYEARDERLTDRLGLSPIPSRRHERTREAILLDAIAEGHGEGRPIAFSLNNNWYPARRHYLAPYYTAETVRWAVDDLAGTGLVDLWIAPQNPRLGRQSTLRATDKLLGAVPAVPALVRRPGELIRRKDADGHLEQYRYTERTRRMRREQEKLNEALLSVSWTIDVDGMTRNGPVLTFPTVEGKKGSAVVNTANLTMYRVFNGSWEQGGRRYGHWLQGVPSRYRKAVRMDGAETVEHDYPELHTRLLYALAGLTLDRPAYEVDGFERKISKRALNVLYNAGTERSALGAIAAAIRDTLHEDEDGFEYFDGNIYQDRAACAEAARVIAALKDRHQPVAEHFHSGVGLRLQYLDSVLAGKVLTRQLKGGDVALPIHDSFLGLERKGGQLLEDMNAALFEVSEGRADMEKRCRKLHCDINYITSKALTYGRERPVAPAWLAVVPVRPRQLSLFPVEVSVPVGAVSGWVYGSVPFSVRQAVEQKRRALGMTHDEVSAVVGVSRPQFTNAMRGRFGLGRHAVSGLKAFLEAS